MTIGFVLDSCSRNAGGLFESVRGLARSQAALEQRAIVYCVRDDHSDEDVSAWHPLEVRIHPRGIPGTWGYAKGLTSGVLDAGLDILMTHGLWQYCSFVSLLWLKLTRKPNIIHPHGMLDPWALQNSRRKKFLASLLYENEHFRCASAFRALNVSEARSIRALGLENPIALIPNGVDLPVLDQPCRAPWEEWARGRKVLLYLGRLHPKKNLEPLVQAWAEAQKTSASAREWALVIAGWDQGGYEATLKQQVQELGLFRSIHFAGPAFGEAKSAAYQNAAAFILPSVSEGLPVAVLEAWSYAKPVLMTEECNLPEGFTSNAAFRITPGIESIREGLEDLFNSSDQDLAAMGARGRELCEERFSWEKIGTQMREFNQWVLGGGSAPACLYT